MLELRPLQQFADRSRSKTGPTSTPKDKKSARLVALDRAVKELVRQRPVFTPDMDAADLAQMQHIDEAIKAALHEAAEEAAVILSEKAKARKLGKWYRTNQDLYHCYSQTFRKQ